MQERARQQSQGEQDAAAEKAQEELEHVQQLLHAAKAAAAAACEETKRVQLELHEKARLSQVRPPS